MRLGRGFGERVGGFCLTWRKSVLAAVAGITVLTGMQLAHVRFDNAVEIWFVDNDPALLAHQRLVDVYASDELVVIGLEAPDVFLSLIHI